MDTAILRSRILDLAIRGQLVPQDPNEGTADDLLKTIAAQRHIVFDSQADLCNEFLNSLDLKLPNTWTFCKIKNIADVKGGKRIPKGKQLTSENTGHKYIRVLNMKNGTVETDNILFVPYDVYDSIKMYYITKDDVYITVAGTIGRVGTIPEELDHANLTENANKLVLYQIDKNYVALVLKSQFVQKQIEMATTSVGQPKLAIKRIEELIIPLPPLAEQHRIVAKVEELLSEVDKIEQAQTDITQAATILRSRVLDSALKGELTHSNTSEWENVKLGDVAEVARGGSPRPIKEYITTSSDGINWIKIGDTDKGSKYINSCKEKIIKEGIRRSRMIHKGDFLLTNSMSFGRPYISNIEGCIHDGWLVISPKENTFDKEYLYYLLSSNVVYAQFCDKASGSTVSNLNIDKVVGTLIPLPPLAEQHRIVAKIEQLFTEIDKLVK